MIKNTVKRPYFSEEYQMWGVKHFSVDAGEFTGGHTVWHETEAEAERDFNYWVSRGYEIVSELVAVSSFIIEPKQIEAELPVLPTKEVVEGPDLLDMELYVRQVVGDYPYRFLRTIAYILKNGKYDYRHYASDYPNSEVRWLKSEGLLDENGVITGHGSEFIRIMG